MSPISQPKDYDLNRIIVKPLYFGLVVNILIPMGLLLVCFYLENEQSLYNRIYSFANTLFYIFAILSFAQSGLALWMRSQLQNKPMICSKETFEEDFIRSLVVKSRPIFLLIAVIALYGFVYFLLTARFKETVFLVFFSFVIFQLVRPRFGFVRKLIARQEEMVERQIFLRN